VAIQVTTLTKQVLELKTELMAAKLAAQHASSHAQSMASIWKLPQVFANSVSVHQMSNKWLEEQPVVQRQATLGRVMLPCALVLAVMLSVLLFLLFPRYLL
jgi:uncharacterized protein with PhoU and TrkA domain